MKKRHFLTPLELNTQKTSLKLKYEISERGEINSHRSEKRKNEKENGK